MRTTLHPRLAALMLLVLLLAGCDGGIYSGTLIFEGDHHFDAGTRLPGDVLLRAGTADFAAGARVEGTIYVIGGSLIFNGETGGDLVVLDGRVTLGPESVVGADLRQAGGTLDQAETATVRGEMVTGALPLPDTADRRPGGVAGVAQWLAGSLLLAALAGLWAHSRPEMPRRIVRAASQSWPAALALGLLALLVLPILLVMMIFTIVLLPLVFLLAGLILLVVGLGMAALGMTLAQRLASWRGHTLSPGWAAFSGTFLLSLLFQLPLIGSPLLLATAVWLFGAVLLTRFGTSEFRPPDRIVAQEDLSSYARRSGQ
jgi:hypothetical protein